MSRRASGLAVLGAAMALAACGNILGLKDLQPEPADGGGDTGADVAADVVGSDDSGADADGRGSGDGAGDVGADVPQDAIEELSADAPHDGANDTASDAPADVASDGGCGSQTSCGGTCVTLATDDHNCGSCGHDCLTSNPGACAGGVCQPVLMTASNTDAFDIVAVPGSGGTTLYWVDQGASAWSCSAANCTPVAIKTGMTSTQRIAFDGTSHVFWTDYGSGGAADGAIWQYDTGLGSASSVATSRMTPQGIAANASYVFWGEAANNQIARFTRPGGPITTYLTGANSNPAGMAILANALYWADTGTGTVSDCSVTGCVPQPLMTGQSMPIAVGVAPGFVYWTDYASSGAVWRYDSAATSTTQLPGAQSFPIRVAADALGTYWTNFGASSNDGALVGCSGACATAASLEPNLQQPVGLAIDAKAIYYGTTGNHKLWKLAR